MKGIDGFIDMMKVLGFKLMKKVRFIFVLNSISKAFA